MSVYIDYLIYTTDAAVAAALATGNSVTTARAGHHLILLRSKTAPALPESAELLATGHCTNDCPFAKLSGDSLDKYKLAYNTEPVTEIDPETDEEYTVTPPFQFSVFL